MAGDLIPFPGPSQKAKLGPGLARGEVVPILGALLDTYGIGVQRYRLPHHVVRQYHSIGCVEVYERGCVAILNWEERLGIFATFAEAAYAIETRSTVKAHPKRLNLRAS